MRFFQSMELSLFHSRKIAIRTWFCNCPQYLCLFRIVVEYSPSIQDPGKMLVLPNLSDQCFSCQPIRWHPHAPIKITFFHDVQRDIPSWEPSPNQVATRFSHIPFPITILRKDDHTDSVQEERLGLPYWTMIQAIFCRGGRIHMCGHSDVGIFKNLGATSIFTWV